MEIFEINAVHWAIKKALCTEVCLLRLLHTIGITFVFPPGLFAEHDERKEHTALKGHIRRRRGRRVTGRAAQVGHEGRRSEFAGWRERGRHGQRHIGGIDQRGGPVAGCQRAAKEEAAQERQRRRWRRRRPARQGRVHFRGRRETSGTALVHEENHQEEDHARPATGVRRGPGRVQSGRHTAGAAQGRAQFQESEFRRAGQKER